MNITIRGRLTLWFTFAFSAALLCVVGVLALQLYNQLNNEIHRALRTEESWITMMGEHEFPDSLTTQEIKYDSLAAHLNHEMDERYGLKRQFAVLAIKRNPKKVFFSGGVKNVDQLLPANLLQRPAGNYNLIIAGHHYRVRVFRRYWGAVAVGVVNETMFEVAEEAGKILIWLVPLAMLLAIAGGWLMAKLALRPVVAAAQTAESISLSNLTERLSTYSGNDEFGALVATLNRMIARLEEGVKRLQQFTQDAAHELRTPLTILRGDLELAYQDENTSEETRTLLQKTLDRVIVLGQIVENLMLLARSDAGSYPINKTCFRLDTIVQEIFEDIKILAEDHALAVSLQNCGALEFYGDELLIRRLLLNLCDNALKYSSKGNLELSLRQSDSTVEVIIGDTGIGIPAEDLPHLFDRFYRVDESRTSTTGGSGLGLAISKWIVEAHGGNIKITSAVGVGTTVQVIFPYHQSDLLNGILPN